MSHQLNIFILSFGIVQCLLLTIWMLRNQTQKLSNIYFALFIIIVGLQLTFKVLSKIWMVNEVYIPYLISYKLPYLIGPLLFLFVTSRADESWRSRDLLHFIPFVFFTAIEFIGITVFDRYPMVHPYMQALFQITSLGIYSFLSLRRSNSLTKQLIAWLASAEFIIIVTLALMYVYYGQFPDVRLLFVVLTVLIYWISYKMISRSPVFFPVAPAMVTLPGRNVKYAHSSLKPEEADRIASGLQILMRDSKCYADPSLTIDALAGNLNTSRHHLSQVLNERLHKSYGDYISELRLEEACRRLSNPANLRYTIASIALDSGFNTVSSFNDAFKKRFQVTPSRYRDQALKAKSA